MKRVVVFIVFALLCVHLPVAAARRSFDFDDTEVAADATRQTATDKLFELINQAIAMAAPDAATLVQLSQEEIIAWQTGHAISADGGEAWLSGTSLTSGKAAAWLSGQLTSQLAPVVTAPLKNGETAFDLVLRTGNRVLAEVIRTFSIQNPR